MRVIGSNSPKTVLGAIGLDLRASYPPVNAASEEIAKLLQHLCILPTNTAAVETRSEAKRPQAFLAAR